MKQRIGRCIKTPIKGKMNPGIYRINIDGFPSGVYFYRIKAGKMLKTGKFKKII